MEYKGVVVMIDILVSTGIFSAMLGLVTWFLKRHIDRVEEKRELKPSTRANYKYMYKKYVSEELGKRKLADIKYSYVKRFYNQLISEKGFKPNSMEIINTILNPIFKVAVRDGYIRSNPVEGVMTEIKKSTVTVRFALLFGAFTRLGQDIHKTDILEIFGKIIRGWKEIRPLYD